MCFCLFFKVFFISLHFIFILILVKLISVICLGNISHFIFYIFIYYLYFISAFSITGSSELFCIICFQGNRDERETVDVSLAKQDAQVGEKT